MSEKRDNIEVRLNNNGTLDEIIIEDPSTGKCLFHAEQMDDHYYWMRAYGITQDLVVHIGATIGSVAGEPVIDERGFFTHYKKVEGPKVYSDFEWEDSINQSECGEKFATTPVERREEVAKIINRFGIACVLQEIAEIIRQGRKAEHEQMLIMDIDNACEKFIAGDKSCLDKTHCE